MNLIVLEEVLNHIHNWFVRDSTQFQEVDIRNGKLPNDVDNYVRKARFFRIQGSYFNDGLHIYTTPDELLVSSDGDVIVTMDGVSITINTKMDALTDENVPNMKVSLLAIPRPLLLIIEEIEDWEAKYGEVAKGPFFSEEFGGYKYEIRGYSSYGAASSTYSGWRLAFANRLNPYRKMY